jgi:hypothetical protein
MNRGSRFAAATFDKMRSKTEVSLVTAGKGAACALAEGSEGASCTPGKMEAGAAAERDDGG